jgi:hypothetical protein
LPFFPGFAIRFSRCLILNCLQSDILSYCDVCTLHVLDELMDTVGDRTTYKDIKLSRAHGFMVVAALGHREIYFYFCLHFTLNITLVFGWSCISNELFLNGFSFRISNEKNNFIWVCKWYLHLLLH